VEEAFHFVTARLEGQSVSRGAVEKALHGLAAEFDADVAPDPQGNLVFRFPEIRKQFQAGAVMRGKLGLEKQELGDIVYDTADTSSEADARDQAAFDRALKEVDLSRYIAPVDRIGYEADYEVVLQDEMAAAAGKTARSIGTRWG
jgi:hypothetical protein